MVDEGSLNILVERQFTLIRFHNDTVHKLRRKQYTLHKRHHNWNFTKSIFSTRIQSKLFIHVISHKRNCTMMMNELLLFQK